MKIRNIERDFQNRGALYTPERWSLYDQYRTAKDNAIREQQTALEAQRAVLGTAWLLVVASSTARSHWPVASYYHLGRRASGSDPQHGGLWEPRAKNPLTAPWDNF